MKLNLYQAFIAICLVAVVATGCKKEYESAKQMDDRNIRAYIQQNNLNMQQYDTTGIYYQVIAAGTGAPIRYDEKIPLIYTVRSLDNAYSSQDTFVNRYGSFFGYFFTDKARELVKEVLKNQGGTIRIIVPSHLAYGRNGVGAVPSNASLDYTIQVLQSSKLNDYEDFTIQRYLQKNALAGFTKTSTGVYYKIADAGTGSSITVDSTVTVKYTGKLFNDKIFDTSESASFVLSALIPAWQQVLPLIKQGGSVRIITPSAQGYGLDGSSALIPAFSPLDFDIKVTDVKKNE